VNFFWKEWERQIRIEGAAVKCSSKISDSYFASRPRGSQEGAWTSMQSAANVSPLIEERVKSTVAQFKETDVIPRPDFWGGYDIKIQSIEFWQGRPSRLHNRWKYLRDDSSATQWGISRLDP
jgi:pyridoxamine 5'-phosphate oxidase